MLHRYIVPVIAGAILAGVVGLPHAHAIQTETPTAFIRSLGEETIQTLSDTALSEKVRITEFQPLVYYRTRFSHDWTFRVGSALAPCDP